MRIVTMFALAIGIALMESWLQPWLAAFGVALPLTFMYLSLLLVKASFKWIPWLSLLLGVSLDVGSANNVGANTLYFLMLGWLTTLPPVSLKQSRIIWLRNGIVIVATLMQPWYLLLVNRQFDADVHITLLTSLIRTGIVMVTATGIIWASSRNESGAL